MKIDKNVLKVKRVTNVVVLNRCSDSRMQLPITFVRPSAVFQ